MERKMGVAMIYLGTRLENMLWCFFKLEYTAGVMELY